MAAPITHIALTEKVFDKHFANKDKQSFSPVTPKLEKAKVAEGKRLVKMRLDEVIKGEGFPKHSTDFMKALKTRLRHKKISNIKFCQAK